MARKPFFSGNYGSALGSTANAANLIAQAGAVQGRMFQNLGQTIGSSIVKFRENKQKKDQEVAAENMFVRMYDQNPTSPIFQSFGIQNRDEAKAAAKDISKDPSLVNQAMMFAQNQMTMDANQRQKDEFARLNKVREAEQLASGYKLGTNTAAVPPLGTITDPQAYAREAGKAARVENNPFLTQQLAKGIDPRVAAQQATQSRGIQLTPGEQTIDKEFATSIMEFNEADVRKGLAQLKDANEALGESDTLTGPIVSLLPNAFADRVNPKAAEVREAVEEVVQRNLRLVLGAQFTEKEGERLISRAYNPKLDEKENKKRVGRLMESIQKAMDEKLNQRDYFQRNGTLKGYNYRPISIGSIESDMEGSDEAEASAEELAELERLKKLQLQRSGMGQYFNNPNVPNFGNINANQ